MNAYDIAVGDVVRFRDWDDMVDEYGDPSEIWFVREMKGLCGREFTVTAVDRDYYGANHVGIISGHKTGWTVTTNMIKLVADEIDPLVDSNISNFISSYQ